MLNENMVKTEQLSRRSTKYRSQISVISEILETLKDIGDNGMIISTIARIVNLSHYSALEKCQMLARSGLLEQMMRGRTRIFKITRRGMEFILQFQKFKEIALEISLKL